MKPNSDNEMENIADATSPSTDSAIATQLRALTWKPVSEEILSRALASAMQALPKPSPVRVFWRSIPLTVRGAVAACWALSTGLHLATPRDPVIISTSSGSANLIFMQQTNDQINELTQQLESAHIARR
jgi:hypothetical protein